MTDEERQAALQHLRHPTMPDPFIAHDYGVLYRDLPPRRTLRGQLRALAWWRRPEAGEQSSDRA